MYIVKIVLKLKEPKKRKTRSVQKIRKRHAGKEIVKFVLKELAHQKIRLCKYGTGKKIQKILGKF